MLKHTVHGFKLQLWMLLQMDFWLTLHVIMLMVLGSISPSHKYYQHIPAYLIADICIAIAPLFVIHFCPDW